MGHQEHKETLEFQEMQDQQGPQDHLVTTEPLELLATPDKWERGDQMGPRVTEESLALVD